MTQMSIAELKDNYAYLSRFRTLPQAPLPGPPLQSIAPQLSFYNYFIPSIVSHMQDIRLKMLPQAANSPRGLVVMVRQFLNVPNASAIQVGALLVGAES